MLQQKHFLAVIGLSYFMAIAQFAFGAVTLNGAEADIQNAYAKLDARGIIKDSIIVDVGATRVLVGMMANGRLDFVDLTPSGQRQNAVGPLRFSNHSNVEPVWLGEWNKHRPSLRRATRLFVIDQRLFATTVSRDRRATFVEEIHLGIGSPFSTRPFWVRWQKFMTPGWLGTAALVEYEFMGAHPVLSSAAMGYLVLMAWSNFSNWQQSKVQLGARTTLLADLQGRYQLKDLESDAQSRVQDVVMTKPNGQPIRLTEWMAAFPCADQLAQLNK